jgi:protein-S-isoprenylcysteine O-methyltransferase Ste14
MKAVARMAKRLIRWGLIVSAAAAAIFTLAGTWRDPWLWAFVAVWAGATLYAISGVDDDLLRERFRPPVASADRIALAFVRIFALALVVVGAIDSGRWHVAPVASAARAAGLVGMAMGFGLFFRAMHENHFFSAVVRIQNDRGHRVVDSGPYSIVRHPGYGGMLIGMPCAGLALGSTISLAIGVVLSLMIVRRVYFEDAFLRWNLEGYAEYTTRVRHRLVPGVW